MIAGGKLEDLVESFRSECLDLYPEDIDLVTRKERDSRLGIFDSSSREIYLAATGKRTFLTQAVQLTKTPRLLKTALRRTRTAWKSIHGELDFDDLLIANIIRLGAPEAFDFLLEFFREIRALSALNGDQRDQLKTHLESRWQEMTNGVSWDVISANDLIGVLFPSWNNSGPIGQPRKLPQGLHVSTPTDYWLRFLMGEIAQCEVRDQESIQAIIKWRRGDKGAHFLDLSLPEALAIATPAFADKFEQFASHAVDGQKLDGKELRRLASSLFDLLRRSGVSADNETAPGFIPLWRCAIRASINAEEHKEWIRREVIKCLQKSLRLANDVYYYWRSNDQAEIGGPKDHRNLRSSIILEAKKLFEDAPERFLKILDPTHMIDSYWFAEFFSREDQGGPGFDPTEWRWFLRLLILAGEPNPQFIAPQIIPFVQKERMKIGEFVYDFDESNARTLFGDDFSKMLRVISSEIDTSGFDDRECKRIAEAQESARRLMRADADS